VVLLSSSEPLEALDKHGEAITAAFTVVLAISTIGLWTATRRLWAAGERQINVAIRAVTAAQESAEASRDAVTHARQTAERQLRAYVTITNHRATKYRLAIGQTIIPCVTIRNRGQTPAHEVTVTISACFDLKECAATVQHGTDPSAPFTLSPGEKSTHTADVPELDEKLVEALDAGTKVLILLCEVQYTDVFGNRRRTRMRASSNKDADIDADSTVQLEWHGSDNDAT
jgi:hypothetical protein